MRKALVVGVNYYQKMGSLDGCVRDSCSVRAVLESHGNGDPNFDVRLIVSESSKSKLTKAALKDAISDVFSGANDIALLYFAGHGHVDASSGYVLASDARRADDGVSLDEILKLANDSKSKNRMVILDSCYSGAAGSPAATGANAFLSVGVTILTASTSEQTAKESDGQGVFTALFVDALSGGAADLLGNVTPGSVYAYIDQSLSTWEQRPVFKTNVQQFVALRSVPPRVSKEELRRLAEFFTSRGATFQLDPSYEPEKAGRDSNAPPPNEENTQVFALLQKFNRVNLVVPEGAPHMWHAAMQSKACKLTVLGEHYRDLAVRKRI